MFFKRLVRVILVKLFVGITCFFLKQLLPIEVLVDFMEPLYMKAGGSSGVGPSQLIDLNATPPREDSGLPDLNRTPVEEELYNIEWEKVEREKSELAQLLQPLIEKEVNKYGYPSVKPIPSAPEMVEKLIQKMGTPYAKKISEGSAPKGKIFHLCRWLRRAKKNIEDSTKGDMNVRAELSSIIKDFF